MNTFQHVEIDHATIVRNSHLSTVHWGAIAAGVVAGLSIYLFLKLGIATGLSVVDALDGGAPGPNTALWVTVWISLSMLVAAFVGGYVAARMSGLKRASDGILHGLLSWSVSALIFAPLATSVSSVVSGGFDGMYQSVSQNIETDGSSGGAMLSQKLEALLNGNNAAARDIDPAVVQNLRQQIQAGERGPAIDLMVNSLGFERERAAAVLDQTLIVSQRAGQASPSRAMADRAVRTASSATWWLLGAVTLSLLFGVVGGSLGCAGSRRISAPYIEE
jgi:hypothetical protein